MGSEHNFVFCATDWAGFSTTDLPNVLSACCRTCRTSARSSTACQQGFLNFMYLGRAMIHPDGLRAIAAFQDGGTG